MISIRPETSDDCDAIRRLTIKAFTQGEFGHNGEAELIESLRGSGQPYLSLVACWDDEIAGHVLFSPVTIGAVSGMGLAPMSVAPDRQCRGVGSALVKEGLRRLAAQGCPFVVVLGHADYYPRFGFELASEYGVAHGFAGIPQEFFFIKLLADAASIRTGGLAHYQPAFGRQQFDSESF